MPGELIQTFRRTLAKIAEIEQRIVSDQLELVALRGEINELRRALKPDVVPGESVASEGAATARPPRKRPIRRSSTVGAAYRVLRTAGGAMHVDEIMRNIAHMTGLPVKKATLVSNLSRYVVAGDTFKRTAANTFALIDDEDNDLRLVG